MTNTLKLSLLTIFPKLFDSFLSESLVSKAIERNLLNVELINIRDFSDPPHHRVDDTPYGGGPGMVMQAEPIIRSIEKAKQALKSSKTILLSASGKKFSQQDAQRLSKENELIFVCGRYEGVDQRAIDMCIDEEYSIGDYVLMGGEVPAMVIIEAVLRLRPEVLGNHESFIEESFSQSSSESLKLEAPQYTKPAKVRELEVPEVLLSGNHDLIRKWREQQSIIRTKQNRPDLIKN